MSPLCVSCEHDSQGWHRCEHRFGAHHGPMNEMPPESRPTPPPDPDPKPTQAPPAEQASTADAAPAPAKQRLRDRLWSFRAVIAVALASVIIGGLGGAALANVAQDDDERRFGPGQGRFDRGGPDWRRGMGQREWRQDGPPGVPPSGLLTPPTPSPTTS